MMNFDKLSEEMMKKGIIFDDCCIMANSKEDFNEALKLKKAFVKAFRVKPYRIGDVVVIEDPKNFKVKKVSKK